MTKEFTESEELLRQRIAQLENALQRIADIDLMDQGSFIAEEIALSVLQPIGTNKKDVE
jgi:hypothetical protein